MLTAYYETLEREELDRLGRFYTDPVGRWFAKRDVPLRDVERESRQYFDRYPIHRAEIDWSTLSVHEVPGTTDLGVQFSQDYWIRKPDWNDYLYFRLQINAVLNADLKIDEISETIVSKARVSQIGSRG